MAELKDTIEAQGKMIEALAGELEALRTEVEALKEAAAAPAPAADKKAKKKPQIPDAFKVGGKEYKFKFAAFRIDLGNGPRRVEAAKTNAADRKLIVEKFPGLVEEV